MNGLIRLINYLITANYLVEVVDDVQLDLAPLHVRRVGLAVLPPQGLAPQALVDEVAELPERKGPCENSLMYVLCMCIVCIHDGANYFKSSELYCTTMSTMHKILHFIAIPNHLKILVINLYIELNLDVMQGPDVSISIR